MSAATVVFMDIVGFSRKSTVEQRRLIESLTECVRGELQTFRNLEDGDLSLIFLPTGDGMAITFIHGQHQHWKLSSFFSFILLLQTWARDEASSEGTVYLRIGIHTGLIEHIQDINGANNVCGDTINYAQRVMDAANPRQVLFSEEAFRHYIGNDSREHIEPPFSTNCMAIFEGPIEVLAKHRLRMLVYKMTLKPAQEWWCNDDPAAKDEAIISLTPLPKEMGIGFIDRVQTAEHLAFVQLTGLRLIQLLSSRDLNLSSALKRLWVFIPGPLAYHESYLRPPRPTKQQLEDSINRWSGILTSIRSSHPRADIKLGIFEEPPYIGASFLNWEWPGGRIHVSPYLWGVPADECPGYELEWVGEKPPPVYQTYMRGLLYLNQNTKNILPNRRDNP